jgi:hypothetical protein
MIIKHREYIADVSGVVDFGTVQYSVNPGIGATFPWLATVASRFESYSFKKLHFIYETNKSTSTNGSVQGVLDYDAADASPDSKATLMAMSGATRSAVWQEFRFDALRGNYINFAAQRFVRSGVLASNLDIKTYDIGNFFVGASGCADTSVLGELYVEYEVELLTPHVVVTETITAPLAQVMFAKGGTLSKDNFFGTDPVSVGSAIATASVNTVTFNIAGTYVIYFQAEPVITSFVGTGSVTYLEYFQESANPSNFALVSATAGQTMVFSSGIVPWLGEGIYFTITEYLPTVYNLVKQMFQKPHPHTPHPAQLGNFAPPKLLRESTQLADSISLTSEEKSSGKWLRV